MELHIGSKHLAADVAVALDVSGREYLVVVAKATWSIPEPGQRPRPLPPQPLVMSDEYYGEPGESALRYGADMSRFKPRCDVIFDACAYSADGRPVTELVSGFELGSLRKQVRVSGPRWWLRAQDNRAGYELSASEAFTRAPMHYGFAFGGSRWYEQGSDRLCEAHLHNPAGLGYAGPHTAAGMHQQPAHLLEHPQQAVRQPTDRVEPIGLSAIGRHWLPRRTHAGTHDETWRKEVFPLLPSDFDEQFHQCAPEDQQMPYPRGGEMVRLIHLLPQRPDVRFALPALPMHVRVLRQDYSESSPEASADTLFFETEQRRFSVVWRASVPLKRNLQELKDVAIGPIDPLWWKARRAGGGCVGCNTQAEDQTPMERETRA